MNVARETADIHYLHHAIVAQIPKKSVEILLFETHKTSTINMHLNYEQESMTRIASWQTVEERGSEDGETVQYIEVTLGIGRKEFNPDFEYRINGTMTSDGENYTVALHGER